MKEGHSPPTTPGPPLLRPVLLLMLHRAGYDSIM